MKEYKNPSLAVDAIVIRARNLKYEILLIERKNEPEGWAFPGGFVDVGESTEDACKRELFEETNIKAEVIELICVASEPDRDPRQHVVSIVYRASGWNGEAMAKDDAKGFGWFAFDELPKMAFDHFDILKKNCKWFFTSSIF